MQFLDIENNLNELRRNDKKQFRQLCNFFKSSKPGLRAVRGDDQAGVVPEWEENSMEQSSF